MEESDPKQQNLRAWSDNMAKVAEKLQALSTHHLEHRKEAAADTLDPLNLSESFVKLQQALMQNPQELWRHQWQLWGDYMQVWQHASKRMMGLESEPVINPEKEDQRFLAKDWQEHFMFDLIKQSYLVTVKATQDLVNSADALDDKTTKKVDFYLKQYLDALSPTNFVMTNPEILQETLESNGENLANGLENLLNDFKKGDGSQLKISMTDADAFELGKNIAATKGSVVFRNSLFELLQFAPTTEEVNATPLLIIPPWINKYYILDLREKNSMIKWLTDQGFTVFCVSWVNPDESMRDYQFEDYMKEGLFAALSAIEQATGERQIHTVGYCLGGTLLSASLAVMKARGDIKESARVKTATFFTTMVDFEEPGELGVFIDEQQLSVLDAKMDERGYLDGSEMATTFNMLRANDLIWSFVINNYMMGKQPFPFDLLYWNSDSTRMPAKMHSFYLRNMYLENALVEPDKTLLDGTPVDLRKIDTPSFILSTREDHIAPWKSTYRATQLYSGKVKFVLAGSGHIAGVINPPNPEKMKYGYWQYNRRPKDPERWLEKAEHHEGSWWPIWVDWLLTHGKTKIPARQPGDGKLKIIEPAPGRYVRVKV